MQNFEQKKWYDKTWLVIVLCVLFFPVGLYALWRNSILKKGWKIAITILIGVIVAANLSGGSDEKNSCSKVDSEQIQNTSTSESELNNKNEIKKTKSNWTYSETEDKMSGNILYFAKCVSTNELDFQFPYDGGSRGILSVRDLGNGSDVIIKITKGLFAGGSLLGDKARVRFDDEQFMLFGYSSNAVDGSMDIIFIANPAKFISKLRTAKKLMVETTFFNEGQRIMEFDVEGLNWDR